MDEIDVAQAQEEWFRDQRIRKARQLNDVRTETCELVVVDGITGDGCGGPIEEARKAIGASSCLECQIDAESLHKRGLWPLR